MAYQDPNGGWFKSRDGAVIGGVCSGLSEKFKIDVTIIRLIFAVAFLVYGTGLGIYIILWIVLPERK
jgi:phage shock protein C